jgi:hypothetical protein
MEKELFMNSSASISKNDTTTRDNRKFDCSCFRRWIFCFNVKNIIDINEDSDDIQIKNKSTTCNSKTENTGTVKTASNKSEIGNHLKYIWTSTCIILL